jgi:hypothetical protein
MTILVKFVNLVVNLKNIKRHVARDKQVILTSNVNGRPVSDFLMYLHKNQDIKKLYIILLQYLYYSLLS